jgi:hypothetical protein
MASILCGELFIRCFFNELLNAGALPGIVFKKKKRKLRFSFLP